MVTSAEVAASIISCCHGDKLSSASVTNMMTFVYVCVCAELEAEVCGCSLNKFTWPSVSEGHYLHEGNYVHAEMHT